MAFNANATTIPGKGTVLVADPDTAPPTDYLTLDPTTLPTPANAVGWAVLGHTSRDNNVSLSKDGGDVSSVGSWWDEVLRSTRSPTNWNVTVNSIQVDGLTLGLAFGGGVLDTVSGFYDVGDIIPQNKALFILVVDNGGNRLGLYIPNTSVSIGDAPEFSIDSYFEIQLDAAIANSTVTGKKFRWYHAGLKAAIPTIASALPSAASVGQTVTILGTGFLGTTGATGVKFGAVNATSYDVDSDNRILAVVPAGSAGAANIVVTSPVGASSAFSYTRGA
jgi:hypothetical protein